MEQVGIWGSLSFDFFPKRSVGTGTVASRTMQCPVFCCRLPALSAVRDISPSLIDKSGCSLTDSSGKCDRNRRPNVTVASCRRVQSANGQNAASTISSNLLLARPKSLTPRPQRQLNCLGNHRRDNYTPSGETVSRSNFRRIAFPWPARITPLLLGSKSTFNCERSRSFSADVPRSFGRTSPIRRLARSVSDCQAHCQ